MDFKEMTLLQLKAYAKEKGIRGISTLKKEQLVEKLMKSEKYEEKREEKKERRNFKSETIFKVAGRRPGRDHPDDLPGGDLSGHDGPGHHAVLLPAIHVMA